jgi:predicted Rossmann fold flavoprotein
VARAAYDFVVVGAGAAGLFCAGVAARRGKRVLVLEHGPKPGAKILISGGGRCNFTNLKVKAENYISTNPHFCKSALAGFTPQDFINLVEQAGIAYHEKTLGQLFCDDSAQQIIDLLLNRSGGAELRMGVSVRDISYSDRFIIETNRGPVEANALALATGGLSIPKLGASNFAYEAAKKFGLRVVKPRPGLVPLTFSGADLDWMQELAGLSLPVAVRAGKRVFHEGALFTHRGLSGPAVLQISSYLTPGESFTVDMLPGQNAAEALREAKTRRPKAGLKAVLTELLPARLAAYLAGEDTRNMADLPDKFLLAMGGGINQMALHPTGNEGFAKAEVTVGGVDTDDLLSKTCGARNVPGLFVIGEAVDVTGWLGGYNFQWAWSSGHAAGMAV